MSAFGAELKRLREASGLSQSKLAERAGFDHSYVSRLETGARKPSREAVEQLAWRLDATDLERDRLRAAAGFLTVDPLSRLASEPEVSGVLRLLGDETVSIQYREDVRAVLRALVRLSDERLTPDQATYP